MPAKSGVSGCLLLVIPNKMAIATYSPPLDPIGNSARGVQFANVRTSKNGCSVLLTIQVFLQELVKRFKFHAFDNVVKRRSAKIDPCINPRTKDSVEIAELVNEAAAESSSLELRK